MKEIIKTTLEIKWNKSEKNSRSHQELIFFFFEKLGKIGKSFSSLTKKKIEKNSKICMELLQETEQTVQFGERKTSRKQYTFWLKIILKICSSQNNVLT
jgi:hypothetical protein